MLSCVRASCCAFCVAVASHVSYLAARVLSELQSIIYLLYFMSFCLHKRRLTTGEFSRFFHDFQDDEVTERLQEEYAVGFPHAHHLSVCLIKTHGADFSIFMFGLMRSNLAQGNLWKCLICTAECNDDCY